MRLALPLVALCLTACGATSDPVDTDTDVAVEASAYTGEYSVVVAIASFGGIQVPSRVTIDARREDGADILTTVELRADGPQGPSEVLATVTEVPVAADGSFTLDLGEWTLPGAYAPLGSAVDVDMTLEGAIAEDLTMCGDVTGELLTFGVDLAGSTFGGAPYVQGAALPAPSCDGAGEELPRITDCPTLQLGLNTGFPSGGLQRSFYLVAPEGELMGSYPLVFMWHGFGGTAQGFLSEGMAQRARDAGVLLVVPQAADAGGIPGFDVVGPPATNRDLVLFDDVLTCVSEQWSVDGDRVHSTGMSNGGLMTGYLTAHRSDVLASVAPLSGGITTPLGEDFGVPALVVWGGPEDAAFEQDFDALADAMVSSFDDAGAFVVTCEHTGGHTYEDAWWSWVFEFLLDHPADVSPEPYAAGLPEGFPAWCSVVD